jgi:hypothetical protein
MAVVAANSIILCNILAVSIQEAFSWPGHGILFHIAAIFLSCLYVEEAMGTQEAGLQCIWEREQTCKHHGMWLVAGRRWAFL